MHLMGMGSSTRFWRGLFFGSLIGAGIVSMMMTRTTPGTKKMLRRKMRGMGMKAQKAKQVMDYGSDGLSSAYRLGRRTVERTFDQMR